MNYAERQSDPRRHLVGLSVVVLFHVLVVWALVTGLGKKVIEIVRAPIETKVIEEVRKPPPPPEIVVPPPPRLDAPPPPFIPPPEIQIAVPPPPAPTITAVTPTPPPAPVVIAPAPAPAPAPVAVAPAPPAPAPAPAPPAIVQAGVVCPNHAVVMGDNDFPREAVRAGIEKGEALIQFTLTASGEMKDIRTIRASNPIFARNSTRIVGNLKCQAQGREVQVQVPFSYKLQ